MLVINRHRDQSVLIGDDIEVSVVDLRGDTVRLGFTAPRHLPVHRKEVYEAIREIRPPEPKLASPPGADVRLATEDDLKAIDDIYNWYIPRSTCTYQEEIEPFENRLRLFTEHRPQHPITVAEREGQVVGWGSLSAYRNRSAYRFTVENSVYVRNDMQRQGIGATILSDLIQRASSLGHRNIIAGIDAEQTGSVALHSRFGFHHCGRQAKVGYKFDRWLDVIFMQLTLTQ